MVGEIIKEIDYEIEWFEKAEKDYRDAGMPDYEALTRGVVNGLILAKIIIIEDDLFE